MKIQINKTLSAKLLKILKEAPQKAKQAQKIALRRCGDQLRNEAGQNAPYKTGNLRRSITIQEQTATKVVVGTNLEYAKIHDEGGTIPAHTIYPKNKKVLAFKIGGKTIFARSAKIPARKVEPYKGKGYLTPAFEKLRDGDLEKIFNEELIRVIT